MMVPPTIAIVGYSKSGKTRVAATLVRILSERGYRIVAVKHCHHGHQVDGSATDSARLFEAGASLVIASSPDKITYIERTGADTTLEQIAASIAPGYDLVLAEGFKGSTVPKVLVLGKEEISPTPQQVIAIVSDHRTEASPVPCYSFQQLSELAEQIQRQILYPANSSVT
jgi:molybdopterin-guanine dinucleotide biosynthesis protein B